MAAYIEYSMNFQLRGGAYAVISKDSLGKIEIDSRCVSDKSLTLLLSTFLLSIKDQEKKKK